MLPASDVRRELACAVLVGALLRINEWIRDLHTSWRMGFACFLSVVGDLCAWLGGDGDQSKDKILLVLKESMYNYLKNINFF